MKKKDVFTTGQVADICSVAPRTVTKWFDSGKLKGYRIPGSKDRRIPAEELMRFMRTNNMPIPDLDIGVIRILLIDPDVESAEAFAEMLQSDSRYNVEIASNSFEAGMKVQKQMSNVLIVPLFIEAIDAQAISRVVRTNGDLAATKLIAYVDSVDDDQGQVLLEKGYDGIITDLGDFTDCVEQIENATTMIY